MVIAQLSVCLLGLIFRHAGRTINVRFLRHDIRISATKSSLLDYCTFPVIMSYCGRHQPAPKPCVRCLKVFSPEATPLPPTPKLMESQLSLHEEMEALGSNIHNVPLISVGATEGGFLSLLVGFSLPGNPLA